MSPRPLAWLAAFSIAFGTSATLAGVSAVEADLLGSTLTPFGAEKNANKEGSIPAYGGGLPATTNPPGFQKNSGRWTDPFSGEKPLFSITGQNMDRYADKLSEASKALLKRYPGYRMDVYPTHRTVAYPPAVLENTRKNAINAHLSHDGLTLEGAIGGIPFPIVKTGHEAMWNHLNRYNGYAMELRLRSWYVDANGVAVNSAEVHSHTLHPYHTPNWTLEDLKKKGNFTEQAAYDFLGPPQVVGNASLYMDSLDPVEQPRRAWTYSAASRRLRIAPDFAYDTPVASVGGVATYDDRMLFEGKLDMYDFKLLGKREMFIPYGNYTLTFQTPASRLMTPKTLNPDLARWELHRVWVVEATLKKGKRHAYARRVFYFDEDWGGAGMSDSYDNSGQLYKGIFANFVQLYDTQTPSTRSFWGYDLSSGIYFFSIHFGDPGMGLWLRPDGFPKLMFTPDALPTRGGR